MELIFLISVFSLFKLFIKGKQFLHIHLILLGALFYLILPFLAFKYDLYTGGPGKDIWEAEFSKLYPHYFLYLFYTLLLLFSIVAGSYVKIQNSFLSHPDKECQSYIAFALLSIIIPALFYYTFLSKDLLFTGYSEESQNENMGPIATCHLLLTALTLNLYDRKNISFIKSTCLLLSVISAVILLSLGGRLYVLSSLVAYLLLIQDKYQSFRTRVGILVVILIVVLALISIAIWRVGDIFETSTLGKYLIAEFVLTSISMTNLFDCNSISLFNTPYNFLSSYINLIPVFIFPSKHDYLIDLDPTRQCLYSPFGATNILISLSYNFGYIGSILYAFIFSVFYSNLLKSSRWLYIYCSSYIPFMLFRDGFLIFNKVIILGLLLSYLIKYLPSRMRLL